jgi:hypothetical protein
MLSDKEKEVLESVKDMFSDVTIKDIDEQSITIYGVAMLDVIKVLTIVEKKEKEIEKYKNVIDNREFTWKQKYEETFEYVKENFINQDKIKEILGIEEDINNEKLLSLLQTIVDENARLEDIEDRKVQIEYNNVFNKGVKSVEDKIKAKIEEVKDGTFDAKIVLQSLLEKE